MTMNPENPHALYRFFDADEQLLYIGITWDIASRFRRHAADKPWWSDVRRIAVEEHPGRAAVLAAETAAIKAEKPRYNVETVRAVVEPIPTSLLVELVVHHPERGGFIDHADLTPEHAEWIAQYLVDRLPDSVVRNIAALLDSVL